MEVFGDGQANATGSASDEYAFGHVTKSRLFEKIASGQGSTLEDTLLASERARQMLISEKDVQGVFSLVGSSELLEGQIGDAQLMTEMFTSFSSVMMVGVLCIFAVLVLLFKDFMQPLTILVAVPLAVGGAFVMLLLTGKSFSMSASIGLLMLIGIVAKNSILLVEYAIVARQEMQLPRFEALLDACHKRVRPIIMTSMAMGFWHVACCVGAPTLPLAHPWQ
jgi:predicted RND superfamily exporter protein